MNRLRLAVRPIRNLNAAAPEMGSFLRTGDQYSTEFLHSRVFPQLEYTVIKGANSRFPITPTYVV
jgi:hypothetical protein